MLFFRQLIIPGRQPLDKALDLQQRQRGQYAPGRQLRFVDHPVDRLLSALQLPQNGGFVGRYARQNFLYVNISPVFLLVNGFCVSFSGLDEVSATTRLSFVSCGPSVMGPNGLWRRGRSG